MYKKNEEIIKDKKDRVDTNPIDAHVISNNENYCNPIMFAHFVCALFSFCACKFHEKYKKNGNFITECTLYIYIIHKYKFINRKQCNLLLIFVVD